LRYAAATSKKGERMGHAGACLSGVAEEMNRKNDILVLLGAALGGLVGYLVFFALSRRGLYGLALPGGLLGLAAGVFKTRSRVIPVVCGLLALALRLFTEWRYAPFVADGSLGYFLSHVYWS